MNDSNSNRKLSTTNRLSLLQNVVKLSVRKIFNRKFPTYNAQLQIENKSDSTRYNMDHKNRGYAVIIENSKFETFPRLPGQDIDVENYKKTFKRLKFDVVVYHNLKGEEMIDLMNEYAELDFSRHDCFLAVFLSHGDIENNKEYIYGIDEVGITKENIINRFKRNATLFEKPKIFFFDACRGSNIEPTYAKSVTNHMNNISDDMQYKFNHIQNKSNQKEFFSQSDFFYGFSSTRFYRSIATSKGSIYTRVLCDSINNHADEHHLVDIVTLAHNRLKKEKKTVTAELQSTLKKFCYFK